MNPRAGCEREKGQPDAHHHHRERRERQRPAGPALQERNLVGADDVDDQGLRQQRLDEPAGLEQRGVAGCPSSRRRRA